MPFVAYIDGEIVTSDEKFDCENQTYCSQDAYNFAIKYGNKDYKNFMLHNANYLTMSDSIKKMFPDWKSIIRGDYTRVLRDSYGYYNITYDQELGFIVTAGNYPSQIHSFGILPRLNIAGVDTRYNPCYTVGTWCDVAIVNGTYGRRKW